MSPKAVLVCLLFLGIAVAFGYLGIPLIVAHFFVHHAAASPVRYATCPCGGGLG